MEIIALQQAIQTEFRSSLSHDLMTTLALLYPAQVSDGLSHWIYRISDRLLNDPPTGFVETLSCLPFIPQFQGWLTTQLNDCESFDAILAEFDQLSTEEVANAIHAALQARADQPAQHTLAHLESIQTQRDQYNIPPPPIPLVELAELLDDAPQFLHDLRNSLQILWEGGYAERYPLDAARWQAAITYHTQHAQQGDFPTLFRTVTGRNSHEHIRQLAHSSQHIEWIPSCHVGAYVVYNAYAGTLRISFNANITPQSNTAHIADIYPTLKAMADESRLHILSLLVQGEYSVGDLADLLTLSQSTVSRHLALLAKTDLVAVRPQGNLRYYRLNPAGIQHVIDQLQFFQQLSKKGLR